MDGIELKIFRIRRRVRQVRVAALLERSASWLYLREAERVKVSADEAKAILGAIEEAAGGELDPAATVVGGGAR